MCGRYYRKGDKQKIAEAFHANLVEDGTPSPPWDYNVAPTTIQPVIRNNRDSGEREVVSLRWGLIPFFTKDIKDVKGISTINARAETVAASRTYREPFKKRRCLVPASGFYEWKRLDPKNKQPFAFARFISDFSDTSLRFDAPSCRSLVLFSSVACCLS